MAIGEPMVLVVCDRCYDEEYVELTPLAQRSWDMRNVIPALEHQGWEVRGKGESTICSECRKKRETVE